MLLTEYAVGLRNESAASVTDPINIVVDDVLPRGCVPSRADLVKKLQRQDLIVEFVEADGGLCDWIVFPDLPEDVINHLHAGGDLNFLDSSDGTLVSCKLSVAGAKVVGA